MLHLDSVRQLVTVQLVVGRRSCLEISRAYFACAVRSRPQCYWAILVFAVGMLGSISPKIPIICVLPASALHLNASSLSSDQQHELSLGISRCGNCSREASLADMGKYAMIRCAPYPTFQLRGPVDNNLPMLYHEVYLRSVV